MKAKILAGAVVALLYGGVALADDKDCPPGSSVNDTQSSMSSQTTGNESAAVIETQPVDQGIGGSGQVGTEQGVGGSSAAGNEMLLRCQPVKNNTGTGGSGEINQYPSSEQSGSSVGEGGSGYQSEPLREPQVAPEAVPPVEPQVTPPAAPVVPEPSGAFTPTQPIKEEKQHKANMRGLTVTAGGGVEGYSGALAPDINPGPGYGVQADIRPNNVLGLELGYSGAVNNLDPRFVGGASSGPDLVRNGGNAALTVGLTAAPVQPYLMGGIGFSDYNFRGSTLTTGFRDDTVGNVPVGAGLRTHVGDFTADLRANYNFLFSQDFAPLVSEDAGNGRYSGTLNIGGTF